MAAATDAVINLTVNGAGEASSALASATTGLNNITTASSHLEEQFAHKFTHVGLQMFVGEALLANGVGSETRAMVGILSMALTSLGGAFGDVGIVITLVAGIMATFGGLAEKLTENHEAQAEALMKLTDTEDQERVALIASIASMQTYVDTNGPMAASILKVLQAKQQLAAFMEAVEIVNLQKQKEALAQSIVEEVNEVHAMEAGQAAQSSLNAQKMLAIAITQGLSAGVMTIVQKYTDFKQKIADTETEILKHNVSLQETKLKIDMLGSGVQTTAEDMMASWQKTSDAAKKAAEDQVKAVQQVDQERTASAQKEAQNLATLTDKTNQYNLESVESNTSAFQKKNAEADKWMAKQIDDINKVYAADVAYVEKTTTSAYEMDEQLRSLDEARNTALTAAYKDYADKKISVDQSMMNTLQTDSDKYLQGAISGTSDAFAKMLVTGQNFTQSMQKLFQNLEEQFISMVTQMIAKWMMFEALTGGAGMGAGAAGGLMGFAEGGSFVASGPTPIMVGEGGEPEMVSVTPFSQMGMNAPAQQSTTGAGGQSQTFAFGDINIYGITDPTQIANTIGDQIVSRIRSRGDIAFQRSS